MRQLVKSELVYEQGYGQTRTYVFKHALVQDTAYASLLRSRRQAIHAEIARALVERLPDEVDSLPALIAHHYTGAGLTEPAARYWLAAAEWSLARSANAEADRYVEAALSLIPRIDEGPSRRSLELSLHLARANALTPKDGYAAPRTMAALNMAKHLLDEGHGTEMQRFSILAGLCSAYAVAARMEEALVLAREMVKVSHCQEENIYRALSLVNLSSILYFMGSNRDALSVAQSAKLLRDPVRHRQISFRVFDDPSVQTLCYEHLTLLTLGNIDGALQISSQVIKELEDHPHSATVAIGTYMAVTWNTFLYADVELADRAVGELMTYSTERKVEHCRLYCLS